ncbi:MAG: hypothetical protein K0Q57_528 [Gammaproteobacteria bacterium]|jgi:hypothetical protein|nr:hypothetical protein [Gammaproteobacteria bacterium]
MDSKEFQQLVEANEGVAKFYERLEIILQHFENLYKRHMYQTYFSSLQEAKTEVLDYILTLLSLHPDQGPTPEQLICRLYGAMILTIKFFYGPDAGSQITLKQIARAGNLATDIDALKKIEFDLFEAIGFSLPPEKATMEKLSQMRQDAVLKKLTSPLIKDFSEFNFYYFNPLDLRVASLEQDESMPKFEVATKTRDKIAQLMQEHIKRQMDYIQSTGLYDASFFTELKALCTDAQNILLVNIGALKLEIKEAKSRQYDYVSKSKKVLAEGHVPEAEIFRRAIASIDDAVNEYYHKQTAELELTGKTNPSFSAGFKKEMAYIQKTCNERLIKMLGVRAELNDLNTALNSFFDKIPNFKERGLSAKASRADGLRVDIEKIMTAYIAAQFNEIMETGRANPSLIKPLKQDCQTLIAAAKPHFEEHSDILPMLGNILLGVASLGMASVIGRLVNGSFAIFQPNSIWKIREIEACLQ